MEELKSMEKELNRTIKGLVKLINDNYKAIEELNLYIKNGKDKEKKKGMVKLTEQILKQNISAIKTKAVSMSLLGRVKTMMFSLSLKK